MIAQTKPTKLSPDLFGFTFPKHDQEICSDDDCDYDYDYDFNGEDKMTYYSGKLNSYIFRGGFNGVYDPYGYINDFLDPNDKNYDEYYSSLDFAIRTAPVSYCDVFLPPSPRLFGESCDYELDDDNHVQLKPTRFYYP